MKLSHRDRLHACLSNDASQDRAPVTLWRHFPVDDQSPETLAAATLAFQKLYDFDLVKVSPASSFCLKDWGIEDEWRGDPEGTRYYTKRVISTPQDWERLPMLEPTATHLAEQITCLRILRKELGPEIPILQTIFNPLSQAKNLAGNDKLLAHIRQYPQHVMKGLTIIAETTRRFIETAIDVGIDGVFFAIQHAQDNVLSQEEYQTFGIPTDMTVLEPAKSLWCNLLHMHGKGIYFNLITHFENLISIVNWHDRETSPSLFDAQKQFNGIVCGGINQRTIVFCNKTEIEKEAADAIAQTNGKRFILGTGCVVPIIAPYGNILVSRKAVEIPAAAF